MSNQDDIDRKAKAVLKQWLSELLIEIPPKRLEVCVLDSRQRAVSLVRLFTDIDQTKLEEIATRAIAACRHDCDQLGDEVLYAVLAVHPDKAVDAYSRWLCRFTPSTTGSAA